MSESTRPPIPSCRVGAAGPRGDGSPSAAWAGPDLGVPPGMTPVVNPPFAQFTVWASIVPGNDGVILECRLCHWRRRGQRVELLELAVDAFDHYFRCGD